MDEPRYDRNIVEGRIYQVIYHLVNAYLENAREGKSENIATSSVEIARETIPPTVNGLKALEEERDICLLLSHAVHHELCCCLEGSLIFFDIWRNKCNGDNTSYWYLSDEHEYAGKSVMELADIIMQGKREYLTQRYLKAHTQDEAMQLLRS